MLNNQGKKSSIKDLTGKTFNRLTVTGFSHVNKFHHAYWNCLCSCGNTTVVKGTDLTRPYAHVKSCGCLLRDTRKNTPKPEKVTYSEVREHDRNYKKHLYTANSRHKATSLSFEQWLELVQQNCSYCGISPVHNDNGFLYNGIDRVDNSKDYHYNNLVPACTDCNRTKNNKSLEDFLDSNWLANRRERIFNGQKIIQVAFNKSHVEYLQQTWFMI